MSFKVLSLFCLFPFTIYYLNVDFSRKNEVENSAPEVRIAKPVDQSSIQWNTIIPFAISVSDQEDGKSEYDEIEKNKILLEVTYLSDASLVLEYSKGRSDIDRHTLRQISNSNCLTCHAAKTKLIGPSFDLIADRYANQSQAAEKLASKMITGSTGVWGDVPMPAHPNLDREMATKMINWILNIGTIPNYSFYTGTQGAFKTREREGDDNKGFYILTASYADRGIEGVPESSKEGQHTVMLFIKE